MISVGIEDMNVFAGNAYVDVTELATHRDLDTKRFNNLLMKEKTVVLPYEDPITFGVSAAKPIIDNLNEDEKNRIEMVITCTESAFDFGKSMSTYFHDLLGLDRNCRLFELKNACYSGSAGLQMASSFITSQLSPGAKALVIATDISRFTVAEGGDALTEEWSFAEPTGGSGAVAMLVSDKPYIFMLDQGANGYYGYEVMDTCRPLPESEAGDTDLSLLSYLDCCENSFKEYSKRVEDVDYSSTFQFLSFHTPFGGMVKGAHRNMMRKFKKSNPNEIEKDFERRVYPGLIYCQKVGNIMGASSALSLSSTIDNASFETPQRIGCFSYGSGCCSEFFSGIVTSEGQNRLRKFNIMEKLNKRYQLNMEEYDSIIANSNTVKLGTRNIVLDDTFVENARYALNGTPRLFLKEIKEYHRSYEWLS